jgi:glycosyltransferase involved in cell wall biosynthesis
MSTTTPNTITAIIPVHNGERHLAEAIQSVLAQTLPPGEIIVVDDGSTDASAAIAQSFGAPVRVLAQPNLGPAAARNLGLAHATGDLLAFLDADDLWTPNKLARQA